MRCTARLASPFGRMLRKETGVGSEAVNAMLNEAHTHTHTHTAYLGLILKDHYQTTPFLLFLPLGSLNESYLMTSQKSLLRRVYDMVQEGVWW